MEASCGGDHTASAIVGNILVLTPHTTRTGVTDARRHADRRRTRGGTNRPGDDGMTVEIVSPDELETDESTPGIARETVFETEHNVMVRSTVAGGTTTGWHHHGDRHAYGYVIEGSASVEYGPAGEQTDRASSGDFFYVAPGTVHRELNPTDEEAVVLVSFVGTGPLVENVEGPGRE